jgi:hypothetical protein
MLSDYFIAGFLRFNNSFDAVNTWVMGGGPFQIRNGTTADSLRVYNTYTDASNGEWGALDWQTTPNVLTIGTQANGTGAARGLLLKSGSLTLDFGVSYGGWQTITGPLMMSGNPTISAISGGISISAPSGVNAYNFTSILYSAAPTITGAGGTCATSTKVGGLVAGTVVLSGVCATGNTIAWTGLQPAPTGFACDAEDRTTRTAGPFIQSATTTTGFTLTVGATSSVAGDILQFKCMGY